MTTPSEELTALIVNLRDQGYSWGQLADRARP